LGHKVHPIGFRLGFVKDWQAKWYADKAYTVLIQEDLRIRKAIEYKYGFDDISRVEIERSANQVTVAVYTARPGIVIGRGGQRVDEMRQVLEKTAGKRVRLNILEVAQPELDAYLVARSIAQQMERRISHRRAMKQAISRAMERGAQGIKITCAGRLSGSEYARRETLHQGRVPLHTLRADIDYAQAEAHTTLGRTGVKVWIYKGDVISEAEKMFMERSLLTPVEEVAPAEIEPDVTEVATLKDSAGDAEAEVKETAEVVNLEKTAEERGAAEEENKATAEVETEGEAKAETVIADEPKAKVKAKAKIKKEAATTEEPKAKARSKAKEGDKAAAKTAEKTGARSKTKAKKENEPADKPATKTKSKAEKKTDTGISGDSETKSKKKAKPKEPAEPQNAD
jgi:small subunit ribosomal protein S3